MNPETIKLAYTKANMRPSVDIKEFTKEELIALLITCDGVGMAMKEKILSHLLK